MRSHFLYILTTASAALAQSPNWADAYESANADLAKLSLNDKVNIVTGIGWNAGGTCVGNTAAVSSINYPSLCLQDGPLGVRYASSVTAFTPGIQAGATWDRELIRQRGQFMGEEARGCGVHVMLGPAPGALGKIPNGGRNWEGFGADPYLQGIATAETVAGFLAVGVQPTAKHYIVNEQELNRETMSSDVDDRSLHELYLWPFADAVHANVAALMCSYNKINGTWACENDRVLNQIAKEELGFKGYVMTDWNAQHSTVESAVNGLDMTMPGSDFNGGNVLWGPALSQAVNSGRVPQERVDDMVRRILASWYFYGQDQDFPSVNLDANVQGNHKENVRAVARDGIVLLKNDDAILPLNKPGKIALVGSAAATGNHAENGCADHGCNEGALGMGWGSGTADYTYFVSPEDAIKERAQSDGTEVGTSLTDQTSGVGSAVSGADVAFVFITADSGEGYITVEDNVGDRKTLDPWHNGNQLVQAVAEASDNVVVVVHSVGPIVLDSILSNPSVKAIVWAGLPSQENGNALVDVLYGEVSPSGKLPYTIAKKESDYGSRVVQGDDNFSEGLFIDYRHFDAEDIEPQYEFGFGLCKFSCLTFSSAFSSLLKLSKSSWVANG